MTEHERPKRKPRTVEADGMWDDEWPPLPQPVHWCERCQENVRASWNSGRWRWQCPRCFELTGADGR